MASSTEQYDNVLLGILQNEGKIGPFLEAVFCFLYRRTDFYRILHDPTDKMGFPEGVAEQLVLQAFKKYQQYAMQDEEKRQQESLNTTENSIPEVASFVEVNNERLEKEEKDTGKEDGELTNTEKTVPFSSKCQQPTGSRKKAREVRSTSEGYNGAIRDNYNWSQSINDLDVQVKVPEYVMKAKLVRVTLGCSNLKIDIQTDTGQWETMLDGQLTWKINKEQSMWTLIPGEHVHVNFEKLEERWWDALLVDEPKINVHEIDPVKNMDDLPEDEKAKIDELLFNERQKRLNKPTIEQMKIQNILKEAWDIEGSPFRGQPFDPSIVNISGATDGLCGLDQA